MCYQKCRGVTTHVKRGKWEGGSEPRGKKGDERREILHSEEEGRYYEETERKTDSCEITGI